MSEMRCLAEKAGQCYRPQKVRVEGEPVFLNHHSFTQVKGAKCKLPSEVICSLNNESSSAFAGSTCLCRKHFWGRAAGRGSFFCTELQPGGCIHSLAGKRTGQFWVLILALPQNSYVTLDLSSLSLHLFIFPIRIIVPSLY